MIGTVLSGRYRLEAKLGSGGMSTVYLARDDTLDRPVAVKVMHREMSEQEDQLQRFRQEARAVAKLTHPNVVSVIDAGEDGGHPYIVFEYVKGETLKQRIGRVGALDTQEAIAYAVSRGAFVAVAQSEQCPADAAALSRNNEKAAGFAAKAVRLRPCAGCRRQVRVREAGRRDEFDRPGVLRGRHKLYANKRLIRRREFGEHIEARAGLEGRKLPGGRVRSRRGR